MSDIRDMSAFFDLIFFTYSYMHKLRKNFYFIQSNSFIIFSGQIQFYLSWVWGKWVSMKIDVWFGGKIPYWILVKKMGKKMKRCNKNDKNIIYKMWTFLSISLILMKQNYKKKCNRNAKSIILWKKIEQSLILIKQNCKTM